MFTSLKVSLSYIVHISRVFGSHTAGEVQNNLLECDRLKVDAVGRGCFSEQCDLTSKLIAFAKRRIAPQVKQAECTQAVSVLLRLSPRLTQTDKTQFAVR